MNKKYWSAIALMGLMLPCLAQNEQQVNLSNNLSNNLGNRGGTNRSYNNVQVPIQQQVNFSNTNNFNVQATNYGGNPININTVVSNVNGPSLRNVNFIAINTVQIESNQIPMRGGRGDGNTEVVSRGSRGGNGIQVQSRGNGMPRVQRVQQERVIERIEPMVTLPVNDVNLALNVNVSLPSVALDNVGPEPIPQTRVKASKVRALKVKEPNERDADVKTKTLKREREDREKDTSVRSKKAKKSKRVANGFYRQKKPGLKRAFERLGRKRARKNRGVKTTMACYKF